MFVGTFFAWQSLLDLIPFICMSPVPQVFYTLEAVKLYLDSKGTNTLSPEIKMSMLGYLVYGT